MPQKTEDVEQVVEATYQEFCKVMGMKPDKWNSIFEFVSMVGSNTLFSENLCTAIPDGVFNTIKAYHGPYGSTLIQAYKIRRYSWQGRVSAIPRKLFIYFSFGVHSLKNLKEAWASL